MMYMKSIKRLLSTLLILLTHKPLKTIYFNFKMLPFKQAIRLPIFIYTSTEFRSLEGKIQINGPISPNMIHIGDNTKYISTTKPYSIWTINGTLIFEGACKFFWGSYVYVAENATLKIGTNNTMFGSGCKIICRESVSIGNNVRIAWDCQIYDTSFHYTKSEGKEVQSLTKEIVINDYAWIGNRSTISKGTILPSNSIVASGSLCNKDYTEYGEKCLFAGAPAKCKVTGIERMYTSKEEAYYDEIFNYKRYML